MTTLPPFVCLFWVFFFGQSEDTDGQYTAAVPLIQGGTKGPIASNISLETVLACHLIHTDNCAQLLITRTHTLSLSRALSLSLSLSRTHAILRATGMGESSHSGGIKLYHQRLFKAGS